MKPILALIPLFIITATTFADDEKPSKTRHLKPMKPGVWFGHYGDYRTRAKEVKKTTEAHHSLGKWAWDHGLEDEAWEQWIKAIKIDPNHAKTRKSMGFVKQNDKWTRPGKVNPKWIKTVEADGRALKIDITIEDDADKVFFEEFKWRLNRLNWFIWDITQGQLYIKEINVTDNATGGRFVIQKGKLDIPVLRGGGAFCRMPGRKNWQVFSGGRCYVRILAHEMCHGVFGLPDERHGCYCLMQGGLYGIKTKDLVLCDEHSHRHHPITPDACWKIIKKRYPKMKYPNPNKNIGRVPDAIIKIKDTKKTTTNQL